MNTKKQEVKVYDERFNIYDIANSMKEKIAKGWRIHTCLKSSGKILVVYEKKLETWN